MSSFNKKGKIEFVKNNLNTHYGLEYKPKILNIKQQYYLSIVAIFKNESWILKEWIEHYLNQGVDHFFLIDNGSTDNYNTILQPYIDNKQVSLVKDPKRYSQKGHYNKYIFPIKNISEWFLVCDLDEFVYARKMFKTIPEYLKSLNETVGNVLIPWKNYGSSGHIQHPKDGVVKNFTKRQHYLKETTNNVKSIIRSKYLNFFSIHVQDCDADKLKIRSDNKILDNLIRTSLQNISEDILKNSFLHINHYQIQSVEFFQKIKMTRGDVSTAKKNNIRDMNMFIKIDKNTNEFVDTELKDIQQNYSNN